MLKLTSRIAIQSCSPLHDRERRALNGRMRGLKRLRSPTWWLVGCVFTSSSTGPVTGAPGPAESRWRKQKFGSPLPTSLESCWATTTRPNGCQCSPLQPSGQKNDKMAVCPKKYLRVWAVIKTTKLADSLHFVALSSLVDGGFARCWPPGASSSRATSEQLPEVKPFCLQNKTTTRRASGNNQVAQIIFCFGSYQPDILYFMLAHLTGLHLKPRWKSPTKTQPVTSQKPLGFLNHEKICQINTSDSFYPPAEPLAPKCHCCVCSCRYISANFYQSIKFYSYSTFQTIQNAKQSALQVI